ncbi:sulfurtransferase [Flavobacterium sp. LS1P28]|uniref:sulfurtransferase n=1 Tax=Flavobacterium sp. LS1P28 TaxID=2497752 RepID=UPI000F847E84|nr:sulfurtransferase [Flavobacterium sp. LS1P28]RTY85360.1 sulfurtransferase [Flavobacterium sp. LS1P28]
MNKHLSPLIEAAELLELYKTDPLVLVDASNGKEAKVVYKAKHLDQALFVDLNTDLADIKEDFANGGRRPLPEIEKFAETLTKLGITNSSHVVIYDDKNGANAAARFWWMLRAIGHEKVQVLNGGLQQAENIGFPTNNKTETPKIVANYTFDNWKLPTATITEVENNSQNKNYLVIDVRENSRYRGVSEPIDLVAGHIPGAINIPFTSNLNENGRFLPPAELRQKYQEIFGATKMGNIIFHCGSGVTACQTLLAIDYAALEIPKLYVGSWSEWSRNEKTIATKL